MFHLEQNEKHFIRGTHTGPQNVKKTQQHQKHQYQQYAYTFILLSYCILCRLYVFLTLLIYFLVNSALLKITLSGIGHLYKELYYYYYYYYYYYDKIIINSYQQSTTTINSKSTPLSTQLPATDQSAAGVKQIYLGPPPGE